MEGNVIVPNGWPLGLGNMNSRIRVADTSHTAAPPPPPPQPNAPPILRSSSVSSFSSSNLDTESTASFFPDRSVPLGRLIGIAPANGRSLYCEQGRKIVYETETVPKGRGHYNGLCIPLIHHVIGRIGRGGSSSTY